MLIKDYLFRELYLGLKVAASFNRDESFTKTIDRQIRCITAKFKSQETNVAWNVSYINVFIPAWMVPRFIIASAQNTFEQQTPRVQWELKASAPLGSNLTEPVAFRRLYGT